MNPVRNAIASMKGYVPGLQPDPREPYIKLNSNENPYPPSRRVKEVLERIPYEDLRLYPDPVSLELRERLGKLLGFSASQIICGNGSDDILRILVQTFAEAGESIGFCEPTFPLYRILGNIHSLKTVALRIAEPYTHPPSIPPNLKLFFWANPNSPVGFFYSPGKIAQMARLTDGIFVVDEAYVEFADENALDLVRQMENVIVVRTVSKSYSLAGARLGYAIGEEKWIAEMFKSKDPFNVTRLTQAVVAAALEDQETFKRQIAQIRRTREWFSQEARTLGYRLVPSQANFIFLQPPQKGRGRQFYEALLARKILARYYDESGLQDGVRLTIGKREDMEKVLQILQELVREFPLP
jgi:histidinol-phosphate aminotransferase